MIGATATAEVDETRACVERGADRHPAGDERERGAHPRQERPLAREGDAGIDLGVGGRDGGIDCRLLLGHHARSR